jgi:SAM-dependent methyltransferase
VSELDRNHWDVRHAQQGMAPIGDPVPPAVFAAFEALFPTAGFALELACGRGRAALWLASRGMGVHGVDVSPVAIDLARKLLAHSALAERCRFEVLDLDDGLPDGPPADLILCHLFRDARLDRSLVERLAPGGLLAIAVLSEVGAEPGRFRARPGELHAAFAALEIVAEGEAEGFAWLLGRARARP